ncbi:MAG: hypothetical protein IPL41_10635 [Micropruina sp.]|nr:hypothetical protein [Micropruina sp.]
MTEPDDRAERALRDTLRTHADGPIFRPLTVDVAAAPRRRWTRWLPAAALIALAVLVVPLVINQAGGGGGTTAAVPAGDSGAERSDTTAAAEATGSAPSTPGLRWESYRVLSYQVPTSWGYGWAPAKDWCAAGSSVTKYGAIVDVAPELRAVAAIACPRAIPATRLSMFVTVRVVGFDRGWDLPSGWRIAATELDGYRLEVVHPEKEARVAAEIVASVRPIGEVDPNGCSAVGALGGSSAPNAGGVSLCQYDLAQGRQLVASTALSGRQADEVVEALATAPKGSGPDDSSCQGEGDTFVIVRVWGEQPSDVRVRYSGCQGNGITNQGQAQQLTGEACQAIMVPPITFTSGFGRAARMCAPEPTASAVPSETQPAPSTTR